MTVVLGTHVRLLVGTCVARWTYLTREAELRVLPHAGDAVRVRGMGSPWRVEYVIVDEVSGILTAKFEHCDVRNAKLYDFWLERLGMLGWSVDSRGGAVR